MAQIKSLLNDVEVNVDCLTSYYKNLVDKGQRALWVLQVESYKESDQWLNEPKGVDDMYHEGRRFNDNDRVVDVILGCMRQQIQKQLFGSIHGETDESILAKSFEHYITNIDESKLNEWINRSVFNFN